MSYIKFNFYEFNLKNYFNNHFLIYIKIIKFYGHKKFINLIINHKINRYFH